MLNRIARIAVRHADRRAARALLKALPGYAFNAAHSWPLLVPSGKPVFCLSFDCDTEEDAEALPSLLARLKQAELPASFALVGELVETTPEPYGLIARNGHEVLNHGYSRHTQQRADGTFYASGFYDRLAPEEIRRQVVDNHRVIDDLLGIRAQGFRTPHFSTFQNDEQRAFLYGVLQDQGYAYSSSVTSAVLQGSGDPHEDGLWEFPITGCWDDLFSPFDSWGLIAAPDRRYRDEDFHRLFRRMLETVIDSPCPLFLNFYFDPAHVVDFDGFDLMLDDIVSVRDKIQVTRYSDLAEELTESLRRGP